MIVASALLPEPIGNWRRSGGLWCLKIRPFTGGGLREPAWPAKERVLDSATGRQEWVADPGSSPEDHCTPLEGPLSSWHDG